MAQPRRMVTTKEAANTLALSRQTIEKLIKSKALDAVKIGGSVRIKAESLDRVAANGASVKRGR